EDASEVAWRLIASGRSSTLIATSRAELFAGAGAAMISIDPVDERSPGRALAGLGPEHRNLLAAACACGDAPFRPRLLAQAAGFDLHAAGELLRNLLQSGLVIQLDARYSRCS